MKSTLFTLLDLLDRENVHYKLERTRGESIQINAVLVGARIEIEVFEDGHIEISRFTGNEGVESGSIEMVELAIKDLS